ncbi:ankyrin repeat protein [Pandoravirus inopinatum]|uniref:Ankyrin repeat protein n=1 Tax=Pandoravirus inopinatum TaxID=1605721 RepID=A0A0B5IVZ8_9VIRU|nr:ankyrin repeat protein [Pandoravirus inopinatum]AJF96843.1 ankyrin repeat protein [Pandoravirus inopinatum]
MAMMATTTTITADQQPTPLGLVDLPAEIIAHILGCLASLRDLAACAATCSALVDTTVLEAAASRFAHATGPRLLEAGAPLCVIQRVVQDRALTDVPHEWVVAATRGGRIDVVEWVCNVATFPPATLPRAKRARRERDDSNPAPGQKRVRPDIGYDSPIVDALYESLNHGKHDAFAWLLDNWERPVFGLPPGPSARPVESLLVEAVHAPGTPFDIIACIHGDCPSTRFTCSDTVHLAAADADRVDVITWLHSLGCRCNPPSPSDGDANDLFWRALYTGSAKVARWVYDTFGLCKHRHRCATEFQRIFVDMGSRGHASCAALLCNLGFGPLSVEFLIAAARAGHLDVLSQCMDDRPGDDNGAGGHRPIVAVGWPSLAIGHAAAAAGRGDVIRWLAGRADARRNLSVGAARLALESGHFDVVLVLHEAGIAPFDRWNSLCAALTGDIARAGHGLTAPTPTTVALVAAYVGACDPSVFVEALRCGGDQIVAFLCERYGTGHAQAAVDAIAGSPLCENALLWLRDNVAGICVADACAYFHMADVDGYSRDKPSPMCWCPRCFQQAPSPIDSMDDVQNRLLGRGS